MPLPKKTATKKTVVKRKAPLKKQTTPSITHPRERINVEAIIDALEKHVMGAQEMSATQVSAALALLKKTLPDIADNTRKAEAAPIIAALSHEDALSALE